MNFFDVLLLFSPVSIIVTALYIIYLLAAVEKKWPMMWTVVYPFFLGLGLTENYLALDGAHNRFAVIIIGLIAVYSVSLFASIFTLFIVRGMDKTKTSLLISSLIAATLGVFLTYFLS